MGYLERQHLCAATATVTALRCYMTFITKSVQRNRSDRDKVLTLPTIPLDVRVYMFACIIFWSLSSLTLHSSQRVKGLLAYPHLCECVRQCACVCVSVCLTWWLSQVRDEVSAAHCSVISPRNCHWACVLGTRQDARTSDLRPRTSNLEPLSSVVCSGGSVLLAALLSFRNNYLFNVKQYELYECTRFGRSDQFCVKCLRVCPCVGISLSPYASVC